MRFYELLGTRVSPLSQHELLSVVANTVRDGTRLVMAHHNLHSLYLCRRDRKMREFYDLADAVFIDGMGVVAVARILGANAGRHQRTTAADWAPALFARAAQEGWTVFHLGQAPETGAKAADILAARFPGMRFVSHHGFFAKTGDDNQAILAAIRAVNPDVLLVGMGMPLQERWVLDNVDDLSCNVIMTVGAYVDLLVGSVRVAPRWMGRIGLEWLFRLITEPRRLWRRYLLEPWAVLFTLLSELTISQGRRAVVEATSDRNDASFKAARHHRR